MRNTVVLFICALMLCSCGAYKRQAYLQDMEPGVQYRAEAAPDARIAKGDKLKIIVTASEPVLAQPFNLVTGGAEYGSVSSEEGIAAESRADRSYTVDRNGNINFPVLGRVLVEGMTLEELSTFIENKIVATGMLKEPIVLTEFTNYTFTILGEAGNGNFTIPDGSINIFQALAMAGDIGGYGVKNDVWVIRTEGGIRQVYSLNLKSKDVFDSPAFYLQQNDMVYVKPRKLKMDEPASGVMSIFSTVFSTVSSLLTSFLWYSVYTR